MRVFRIKCVCMTTPIPAGKYKVSQHVYKTCFLAKSVAEAMLVATKFHKRFDKTSDTETEVYFKSIKDLGHAVEN